MLLLPPPPLPLKIFAVIISFLLLSSSPLDINRSGLLFFAEASRAYPHGCLYRHPSYYTYDERDDISWFNHQNNYDETFSAQLSTSATTTTIAAATGAARSTTTAASEFTDYRKLPPKNHPIRRTYQQYKLLRRLGAGKFSNVFEAVDVYMAAAAVHANNNNDYDDVIQKKQRRKKMVTSSADDALSNEATTTTDSSDNESTTSQSSSSSSSTKPSIDPNTLVVLKCLKPISERKIRRELLVLTHCQNLPNLARLIGIVIPPSSMDLEEENNDDDGKGVVVDDKEGNDNFSEKRVNGGEKESRRHHQSLQHQSHNHRKRRRYSHRTSRQSQQKQQHNQQRRRQQHHDIGSITTDAHNLPEKDANLANKKNVNNGNNRDNKKNNSTSQQQHGEQIPALVLEHAGQRAQWFCHGPRPSSSSPENKTAQQTSMYRGRHSYQNHLTEYEMKYYLCHLLIALDGLHAAGIMHRDVKPRNTLINLNSEPLFAASSCEERRKTSSSGMMMGSCASSIVQSSTSTSSSSQSHSLTTLPSTLPSPPLMLVDLGLADFYLPGKEFNVRVASRHYKSPELLIGYEYYDYAIDMWSVGCILAGLLFRIEPFFRGVDNEDQLGQIVNCLGTRDFLPYCRKCNVRLSSKARAAIGKYCSESSSSSSSSSEDSAAPISFSNSDIGRRKPWLSYLNPDCPIPSSEATDLLDKLLVYDHEQRWTAREALGHAFFDEVRDEVWNEVQERILWESQRRSFSSTSV